jgi:hypothetical protein
MGIGHINDTWSFCVQLCGHVLRLNLKTPNWKEQAEKEIELCTNNTTPLCDNVEPISVTNGDDIYSKFYIWTFFFPSYAIYLNGY